MSFAVSVYLVEAGPCHGRDVTRLEMPARVQMDMMLVAEVVLEQLDVLDDAAGFDHGVPAGDAGPEGHHGRCLVDYPLHLEVRVAEASFVNKDRVLALLFQRQGAVEAGPAADPRQ